MQDYIIEIIPTVTLRIFSNNFISPDNNTYINNDIK